MSKFSYFSRIFVINLAKHKDRFKFIESQLQKSDIYDLVEKFVAVDGANLDLRIIDSSVITEQARERILSGKQKTFGVDLTYGSLGCALSHLLILQECCEADKPYLILEDDIIINDLENKLFDCIEELPKDFDLLYLGLHQLPHLNKDQSYSKNLYIPTGLTCGTFGMIISPVGAKKILDHVFPLSVQIDSQISRNKKHLKVFATKEQLVKHNFNFGSSTQQKRGCVTNVK